MNNPRKEGKKMTPAISTIRTWSLADRYGAMDEKDDALLLDSEKEELIQETEEENAKRTY